MQEFTVDYNRVGRSPTARVSIWPKQRGRVEVGQVVLVRGDDVPDRKAVVESVGDDGRHAILRFGGDVPPSAQPRKRHRPTAGLLRHLGHLGVARARGA